MSHLAIATVDAYTIWNKDVYQLRQKYKWRESLWKQLHPWAINNNETANNRPIEAQYFHQFLGTIEEDDDEYSAILFDIKTDDEILQEEISMVGVEEAFVNVDFKKIFTNFEIIDYEFRYRRLRTPIYLIVDYSWVGEGEDFESEIDVIGYLDNNLDKKLFNEEK